jgi:peptidoglycan LD-endopeptidase LytH
MSARRSALRLVLTLACSACARAGVTLDPMPAPVSTGPAADVRFYDPARGVVTVDDLESLRNRVLGVPVIGIYPRDVPNTFLAGRSGGRRHNASDIMAPRGTMVLSADSGVIQRLSSNTLGGITIYATDPTGRFAYYYAHLDAYASGVRVGQTVRRGELLGYVGSTGNAQASAPHLHFQILRVRDPLRLADGVPIDPQPFFQLPGTLR